MMTSAAPFDHIVRLGVVVAALVALAGCGASPDPAPTSRPKPRAPAPAGELAIESDPVGVSVFVEGVLVGTAPLVAKVESGTRVVAWSYRDRNYTPALVDVAPGGRTEYRIRLNVAPDDSPTRRDQSMAEAAALDVKLRALHCLQKAHPIGSVRAQVRVTLSPDAPPRVTLVDVSSSAAGLEACISALGATLSDRAVSRPTDSLLRLELTE